MKKIKINHLVYFIIALSVLLLLIAVYKTEKKHEEDSMLVVNNKIKEAAKECYLKKDCESEIVLKDLYDKKYLDEVVNPVTKEIMDYDMCIVYKEEQVEFCD